MTLCSICCGQLQHLLWSSWLSEPPGSAAAEVGGGHCKRLAVLLPHRMWLLMCTRPNIALQAPEQHAAALHLQQLVSDMDQAALLHPLPEEFAVTRPILLVQELADHIDQAAVLQGLVVDGQQGLAERWAATLAHGQQVALVAFCVEVDRLKEAVRLVRRLRLQQVGAGGGRACVCTAFGGAAAGDSQVFQDPAGWAACEV